MPVNLFVCVSQRDAGGTVHVLQMRVCRCGLLNWFEIIFFPHSVRSPVNYGLEQGPLSCVVFVENHLTSKKVNKKNQML